MQPSADKSTSPTRRTAAIAILFFVGCIIRICISPGRDIGMVRLTVILACALAAFLAPIYRFAKSKPLRKPRLLALAIGLVSAAYFILTAVLQSRDLFAKTEDDCSYLIQMRMLACGRLWMPPLHNPDFFDSFYILVRPVYASQYFPGTALLYVPTIWLHLPLWLMPVCVSGAVVGLTFLIVHDLAGTAAGMLAALYLVSLSWFRMVSILLLAHSPALLFGLLTVWSFLQWRRDRRVRWLLLIGAGAGWGGITRPVDALCYAIPVFVAVLFSMRNDLPRLLRAVGMIAVAASPFLFLQLIFDKNVTGHWLQTPFALYQQTYAPGAGFGFADPGPGAKPDSVLQQKQDYYRAWIRPFIVGHQPGNILRTWATEIFPKILDTVMPVRLLLPIACIGLVRVRSKHWLLAATLPLFITLYSFYTIFIDEYAVAVIPAFALLVVLGVQTLSEVSPRLRAAGAALVIASCLTSLVEINRWLAPIDQQVVDETFESPMLQMVNVNLPVAGDLHKPCVVLFRYYSGRRFYEEPVYNTDVAWPDDAAMIRAHDLGPERDMELVAYYTKLQPRRAFYLLDPRGKEVVNYLGKADDPETIARRLQETKLPK